MRRASDQDETRALGIFAAICGAVAADAVLPVLTRRSGDPGRLVTLAKRHRISTRATAALAEAIRPHDAAAADRLGRRARARRLEALRKAERTAALSMALSAAGIRHLGIKGAVLAQQLYGDVAARDSKDIDLFVDPVAMTRAGAVLRAAGFADTAGHGETDARFGNKHRSFVGDGIEVEVHTRLLDVDALLPLTFDAVWARRETVLLGGVAVPALGMADTMLYLCAHGAQHLWFRLKWLEDIARIAAVADPSIPAEAFERARETGAEAIVASALHLARDVLGTASVAPGPATRASHALVRLSRDAIAAPADHASAPPLGSIMRKLPVQFGMARNWRYRRDLVRLLVLAPRAFDAVALPRGLRWLRVPLRPAMLLRDRWANR